MSTPYRQRQAPFNTQKVTLSGDRSLMPVVECSRDNGADPFGLMKALKAEADEEMPLEDSPEDDWSMRPCDSQQDSQHDDGTIDDDESMATMGSPARRRPERAPWSPEASSFGRAVRAPWSPEASTAAVPLTETPTSPTSADGYSPMAQSARLPDTPAPFPLVGRRRARRDSCAISLAFDDTTATAWRTDDVLSRTIGGMTIEPVAKRQRLGGAGPAGDATGLGDLERAADRDAV